MLCTDCNTPMMLKEMHRNNDGILYVWICVECGKEIKDQCEK
jgi:DNA-directed RNA polymerase subunit RPC12/RpoP